MSATTPLRTHAPLHPLAAENARWSSGFWAGIAQRTAQFGECGYVQAAVFGQHDRFGRRQSFTDLVDDRDLPGPGFLLVRHSRSLPRNWSC